MQIYVKTTSSDLETAGMCAGDELAAGTHEYILTQNEGDIVIIKKILQVLVLIHHLKIFIQN